MVHKRFRSIERQARRSTRSFERDVEREKKKIFDPSSFIEAVGTVPEVFGKVEGVVSKLAETEKAGITARLDAARQKRFRQRGLISTILTSRLGAPLNRLGLSTETGTSQRSLLGG